MALDPIRAEDERTKSLSAGEADYFRRFPFHECFTAPASWHMPLIAMHDYAVAMSQLSLEAFDLILDFGCGPGWLSEFAARQGLRVVGIDASEGTLRICRRRAIEAGVAERTAFVKGDVQRYPFLDGSFQAVVCVAALHHIQDMGAAVREIARILRPGGEAVFLEPGRGHGEKAHSQQAVSEHGTLEQDVLPEDMFRWASEAGFAEFHVVPQYFAFPAMRWNFGQWQEHAKVAHARRPGQHRGAWARLRQLVRLWRETRSGEGTDPGAFPPEWLFHLHFDQWMSDHGCYLMRKRRGDRLRGSGWGDGCQGTVEVLSARVEREEIVLEVRLRNTGQAVWLARTWREFGQVRLGLQRIHPVTGAVEDLDFARFDIPQSVAPGEEVTWTVRGTRPQAAGDVLTRVDLVSEQVKWFQAKTPGGDEPLVTLRLCPGAR